MQYIIRLSDQKENHLVLLTVDESVVKQPAIEVVFDIVGTDDLKHLVTSNIVSEGQLDDLKVIKDMIFDHDTQSSFIRDGLTITTNGKELDPDIPLENSFVEAQRDGVKYMRLDLVVQSNTHSPESLSTPDSMKAYAEIMFLHQIAIGYAIDVTKEYPELIDLISNFEKRNLIEIDVKTAAYRLTALGQKLHDQYLNEAQDLIKRYDIFCDVDIDSTGTARFDTGIGHDFRVAIYEIEGVNPFRARFLLGINDGEWDQLTNWYECLSDVDWYSSIFKLIESAPSIEEIGKDRLLSAIEQGNATLRQEK